MQYARSIPERTGINPVVLFRIADCARLVWARRARENWRSTETDASPFFVRTAGIKINGG